MSEEKRKSALDRVAEWSGYKDLPQEERDELEAGIQAELHPEAQRRGRTRPSASPRLSELEPKAVADHVVDLVRSHIVTQALRLDPSIILPRLESMSLHFSTMLLVGYAKVGLRATDWPHHGCARDAIQEVCEALYTCPGNPGTFGVGALEPEAIALDSEPDDHVAIAMLAAWARVQIDNHERVSVRALATLAEIDPRHLRLLGRKGELTVEDGTVDAEDAKRWLSGRGVVGL